MVARHWLLAERSGFDLLLLDIHIAGIGWLEVARAIRQHERTTGERLSIIALTARSRKEDREQCLAARMDEFLAKPAPVADLWAAIDRVVKHKPPILPSESTLTEPSLLDPHVLLAACGADAFILAKICQALQFYLPDQIANLEGAVRDRDAWQLREAAHQLAGILATFSTEAAALTSDLEDRSASGRLDECRPLVAAGG